jgi:hypothetical protein
MAHISSLGAARFADLSMALIPGGAATAPPFQQMEKILAAIATGQNGLTNDNAVNPAMAAAMAGTGGGAGAVAISSATVPSLFRSLAVAPVVSYTAAEGKKFVRITHVKEFPAMGTPANIVKVPVYGKKNSVQIQGQADSPTMELTLNYIPALWADGHIYCGTDVSPQKTFAKVGDGFVYLFRFTLMDRKPEGYNALTDDTALDTDGSIADGILTGIDVVENTSYYFLGKIEALEVTPSLTDAITAKLTIAVQSEIVGAFTVG